MVISLSNAPVGCRALDVHEPIDGQCEKGATYIWANPGKDPGSEPRACRLAYSEQLYEQVVSALDSARDGTRKMGTVTGWSGSRPREPRGVSIRFDELRGRAPPPKWVR